MQRDKRHLVDPQLKTTQTGQESSGAFIVKSKNDLDRGVRKIRTVSLQKSPSGQMGPDPGSLELRKSTLKLKRTMAPAFEPLALKSCASKSARADQPSIQGTPSRSPLRLTDRRPGEAPPPSALPTTALRGRELQSQWYDRAPTPFALVVLRLWLLASFVISCRGYSFLLCSFLQCLGFL